jgi:hypothetical protein
MLKSSLTFSLRTLLILTAFATLALAADPDQQNNRQPKPSDQAVGSVLVYNYYTSSATDASTQNTRFSVTNTNREEAVAVHLFFIDGGSCATADAFVCLTPNQTATFLASDIDPGTTGYVIAVATNSSTGCPISFNHLTGSVAVKLTSGQAASLSAVAIPALYDGTVRRCAANTPLVTLDFNGREYAQLPRRLALDTVGSLADGNSTLFIVNSLNGNLVTGMTAIGTLFGVLFDDAENPVSFATTVGCQLAQTLSDSFPRTTPRFSAMVPSGHSGWLYVFPTRTGIGVTGAAINFNPGASTDPARFNSGHNLQFLDFTDSQLTVPVFPPTC